MRIQPSFQLYVFLVVLVILLIVLLWFLSRNQWKAHAKRITDGLLASNATPKAIQWEPISPPDANGVRTTNGAYALSGDAGSIEIKAYGKDENAIIEFTKEDKFYFEPVFEKLPVSPISRLLGSLSQNNRLAKNYADSPSARMPMQLSSSDADLELEQPEDIFVEFDVSSVKKPKSGDEGKPVQAIAYIIDPRVAQGRCKTYSAKVTAVYDTVSVSEGSVNASLKKGSSEIDSGSIGTNRSDVMSSTTYDKAQDFKMKVKGTSGSNYFRSSGTWNVE